MFCNSSFMSYLIVSKTGLEDVAEFMLILISENIIMI